MSPLRFYIYEEATIEAAEEAAPAAVKAPAPVVEEAAPTTVTAPAPVVEEEAAPAAENETAPSTEEKVTEEEQKAEEEAGGIPGFEAVFAITGLLAVSYLVLRKRE